MRPRHRSHVALLRTVVAHHRSGVSNLFLGAVLAFVAGAVNAGGFLAIGQYTSHMTGIVSSIADNLALGMFGVVTLGMIALIAFVLGAGCSALLVNWARRNVRSRQYAYPIALEAILLLLFGMLGIGGRYAPQCLALAAPLLCFIMGLQNATITKISGARMRTTHLTGMLTDIGIELGKMSFWHRATGRTGLRPVSADLEKLSMLTQLVAMFFAGGVVGALGFGTFGYLFVIPLAAILLVLCAPQMVGRTRGG